MTFPLKMLLLCAALTLAGCSKNDSNQLASKSPAMVVDSSQSSDITENTGKFVINPQFDKADRFIEGLAAASVAGKFGFIGR
jgi:hypothetical protein